MATMAGIPLYVVKGSYCGGATTRVLPLTILIYDVDGIDGDG